MMKHTFAVCAYKESPYLEQCILSLKEQTVASEIIVATSTPNAYIKSMCDKYELPYYVNEAPSGLARDWNFAYKQSHTEYVTLAHQDDFYEPDYTKNVLEALEKSENPMIAFTDYYEYRQNKKVHNNRNLNIKRLLLSPLKIRRFQKSIFIRRRILSLGNAICCPSVTYVKNALPKVLFKNDFLSNADWQTWELLSKRQGSFVYVDMPLMSHRIHEGSTTTEIIQDKKRQKEDLEILKKFWPGCIAGLIGKLYSQSEKSNEM